ncbi:MAG: hypothetical protein ABIG89_01350 [Candidatus Woesearchaeota archaeon]
MFEEDFAEELEDFKDMYMVQNYQMICQKLLKKGVRVRQHKYIEMRAS